MTEQQVFDMIRARLVHARSEHPMFAENPLQGVDVIRGELPGLECFMTETAYAEKVIEP